MIITQRNIIYWTVIKTIFLFWFKNSQLSADIGYVLYSALGSFYIPSCIMVFVYIRIYYAARARARRSQENKIKRKLSQTKEQQLEQHQQQQRRVSKQKVETQQQQQQQQQQKEELEMKPIKVAVLAQDGNVGGVKDHLHQIQQSVITNINGTAAAAPSDRPSLIAIPHARLDCCSRGSLTNMKPPTGAISSNHTTSVVSMADIRRHSLSTGNVELRTSLTTNYWGPSLSVDRLSVFDGCPTHKRNACCNKSQSSLPSPSNGRKASNLHLTVPTSSLTAINESSSLVTTDVASSPVVGRDCHKEDEEGHIPAETTHQPVAQRPSSLKNGGDRTSSLATTTKHCVTFECLSVDNSVNYSTIKCFNGDQQQQQQQLLLNNDVESERSTTTMTLAELTKPTVAAAVNKRTPLLGLKSRSRFEKLARRILTSGLTEGGNNTSSSEVSNKKRMNSSSTYEWSSSIANEDDHHNYESPSPVNASSEMAMTVVVPSAAINNKNSVSSAGAATTALGNHKTLRTSGSHEMNNEHDMASDGGLDPSSSDSGTLARCTVVRPLKIRFCRPNSGSVHKKSSKAKRQVILHSNQTYLFMLANY